MPDNTVTIQINAVDNATNVMSNVALAVTGINQAVQLGEQIYAAFNRVMDETVGEYTKQADAVRTLNMLNGQSSEDNSRLLEFAGKYGLTVDNLTMAIRTLSKTGVDLNINTLGQMSEHFLTLGTAAERDEYLVKNFGRTGLDLVQILSLGSKAINDQSAAVNKNLILTQKQIDQAHQLGFAEYALNEQLKASKVQIGAVVAGPLTQLLDIENKIAASGKAGVKWYDAIIGPVGGIDMAIRMWKALHDGIDATKTSVDGLSTTTTTFDIEMVKYNAALASSAHILDATGGAIEDLKGEYTSISSYAQTYTKSVNDLATAEDNVSAIELEINKARKQGYSEAGAHMTDLKGKLGDAQKAVDDLRVAEQRQTDMWVLDVLTQQLSTNGLTSSEMDFLLQYQVNTGLITADAARRAKSAYDYALALASIQDKTVTVTTVYTDVYNSKSGYNNPSIGENPSGVGGYGGKKKLASWASAEDKAYAKAHPDIYDTTGLQRGGIIPPGYPNDTYPAMLSSGEKVIPAEKAEQPSMTINFYGWQGDANAAVKQIEHTQQVNRLMND